MTKTKECPSCAMNIDESSEECPICEYRFQSYGAWVKWFAIILVIVFIVFMLF